MDLCFYSAFLSAGHISKRRNVRPRVCFEAYLQAAKLLLGGKERTNKERLGEGWFPHNTRRQALEEYVRHSCSPLCPMSLQGTQ